MTRTFLVTGGTGFVGYRIPKECATSTTSPLRRYKVKIIIFPEYAGEASFVSIIN
uniref:Uncharacterized protein n=1 Tax=Candidatus Kentrum sp. LFY TaxID=2126342 RepID=A0A450UPJ8_9GAMM|nr:MAG: hypothetical protein BECKLFY1418A_GA0070994_104019 [Candidatus Kentron sp. LFY]